MHTHSKHDLQSINATGTLSRTTRTTKNSSALQRASKAQTEDTVLCRICQRNLRPSKFSKIKLKKFRKAQGKGKPMQIVCTSCTESNLGNKKKGADKPPTGKKSAAAKAEKPVTPTERRQRMAAMPT